MQARGVAIITGASRNIGRAIALALAVDGYHLGLLARKDQQALDEVAEEARSQGVDVHTGLVDVRDGAAVHAAIAEVRDRFGQIDVLVNNAAVRRETPFEQITEQEWREILDIVLDGAFHGSAAVLPGMREAGGGRIVNIAGVTGQSGAARRAHVVTAKAGLIGLTKALASEYAEHGVTVNAVSPGLIDTTRAEVPAHHQSKHIPVGRPGAPGEIAAAVRYLISPEAAFVTGHTLNINGGIYLG
ncbi:3-oxoacyl-[acyl-carrier protein] reductase [Tamaricihabitans halophyticus]|uniref:3-oxoacyl-[acyl-carrier protein] reductase n=1 Tax=Tamaricihabitans halophyticus TaxID=1262583 RepID=A0A4R2R3G5_9PSEU|nr:SDR family oxidoreductase [Tamaricihabitans halophyticus]TCP57103.1 3-oxoacyl-[acyl-carrier protein] reductase [Tamaricihabitans halophyticus]